MTNVTEGEDMGDRIAELERKLAEEKGAYLLARKAMEAAEAEANSLRESRGRFEDEAKTARAELERVKAQAEGVAQTNCELHRQVNELNGKMNDYVLRAERLSQELEDMTGAAHKFEAEGDELAKKAERLREALEQKDGILKVVFKTCLKWESAHCPLQAALADAKPAETKGGGA